MTKKDGAKKVRRSVEFSQKTLKQIAAMSERLEASSDTEVLRRVVDKMHELVMAEDAGTKFWRQDAEAAEKQRFRVWYP